MITDCEIEIIDTIVKNVSNNKCAFTRDDIDNYNRDGSLHLYYLQIHLNKKLDFMEPTIGIQSVRLLINDLFHPFNIMIVDGNYIDLEKWDDREILPDDGEVCKIEIISIEPL
jgi:hypothetical protein